MSVYILRRYEGGGVSLLVGGPTRKEIVVLGGHLIFGLRKKGIPQPGLVMLSRIQMGWVSMSMYVCVRSPGLSKPIVQQQYAVVGV